MIRRARWLAVGAVLGALGYQRLARATRSLTSQPDSVSAARQAVGVVRFAAGAAGHAAGAAGWLTRQARHRRAAGRQPQGGVARFISDVREGMDDYLDRHEANMNRQYRRSGNTLVGQLQDDQLQDDKTKDGR
jgi:hypothetical protein